MSQTVNVALELLFCFLSCVGVIYLARDITAWLMRKKKASHATVIITISENQDCPLRELIEFSYFYNDTHASRYIDKVQVRGFTKEIMQTSEELKKALRLPLEIKPYTDMKAEKDE